jgi:hypothetical protein
VTGRVAPELVRAPMAGHVVLGHGEFDIDRGDRGDHRHAGGVARADIVADVGDPQADPAADRRDDPAEGHIQACAVPTAPRSVITVPCSCLTVAAWVSTSWPAMESCPSRVW